MYLEHFGLTEFPFTITPDTDFAFRSRHHQAAINTVLLALAGNEGFVKVTGEVGTGKTLICRHLLANLPEDVVSAYLLNPRLTPNRLLRAVAHELGVRLRRSTDDYTLFRSLEASLLQIARVGRRAVLCIDEAQALPMESLEALRLLSNLETGKRKLIQIVLFGQPELNRKLALDSIRQLAQRITFHYHLGGLTRDDLEYYLAHRLRVAGFTGARLFSRGAVSRLYSASGGIPRLVNILAHKALMLSFGQGKAQVNRRHVNDAASDTIVRKRRVWPWLAAWSLLLAAAGALAWTFIQ